MNQIPFKFSNKKNPEVKFNSCKAIGIFFTSKARLAKKKIINACKWLLVLKNHINEAPPVFPNITTNGLRVHLGSGSVNLQGWINIDARPAKHLHLIKANFLLEEFADGSLSEIYLSHVLEHFSFEDVCKLLNIFNSKLSVNGILRISVPSFDLLVKIYLDNNCELSYIQGALMGGQEYSYNFHMSIFNEKSLKLLLKKHGFKNVTSWDTFSVFGTSLGDFSSAILKINSSNYPISLNLQCQK